MEGLLEGAESRSEVQVMVDEASSIAADIDDDPASFFGSANELGDFWKLILLVTEGHDAEEGDLAFEPF